MKETEMTEIATLIDEALTVRHDEAALVAVRGKVKSLCDRFPLWG
jgi:glycine/serine hydroxymethyltransferase